ncbi:MAG: hypothetical protein M1115_11390, partial [Actinobacteria bacterium]|nr:hypothetical protein [Actinomycetota bacterium]
MATDPSWASVLAYLCWRARHVDAKAALVELCELFTPPVCPHLATGCLQARSHWIPAGPEPLDTCRPGDTGYLQARRHWIPAGPETLDTC